MWIKKKIHYCHLTEYTLKFGWVPPSSKTKSYQLIAYRLKQLPYLRGHKHKPFYTLSSLGLPVQGVHSTKQALSGRRATCRRPKWHTLRYWWSAYNWDYIRCSSCGVNCGNIHDPIKVEPKTLYPTALPLGPPLKIRVGRSPVPNVL